MPTRAVIYFDFCATFCAFSNPIYIYVLKLSECKLAHIFASTYVWGKKAAIFKMLKI